MSNRKSKKFTAFLWHRRIGLAAIVLVAILTVTGILLNHTGSFKLDETYVDSSLLMSWYGLEPDSDPVSYRANGHRITQWGDQLFFDDHVLVKSPQQLKGAIKAEQFIVAALEREVLLIAFDGELIERIPTASSLGETLRLGIKYLRPVIASTNGLFYIADEHIIDWDVILDEGITWPQPAELSDEQLQALHLAYRGKGLTLERVLLDLHSGRIFGEYGVFVMDAAGLALLWLCGSGFWVWNSRRHKQRRKRHYQKHHRA